MIPLLQKQKQNCTHQDTNDRHSSVLSQGGTR